MTTRERRTISIALSIVALAWAATRGFPALLNRIRELTYQAELARRTALAARSAIAQRSLLADALSARAQRVVALAPRLIDGSTAAEASASLSSLIAGSAALHHVRIVRQDARPDTLLSVFRRIGLRLEGEEHRLRIAGFLTELETGTRLIKVRSMAISALEASSAPGQPERLHLDLLVEGLAARHGN